MTGLRLIVTAVDGRKGDAQALQVAAQLAVSHDAVVRVVSVCSDYVADLVNLGIGLGGSLPPSAVQLLQDAQSEARARIAEDCRSAADDARIPFGEGETRPRLLLTPYGRQNWVDMAVELVLADLLVMSRSSFEARTMHVNDVLGDALLRSHSAVLVARGGPEKLAGRSAVAWDGSSQAGRAVKAALPLLARANAVVILQCPAGLTRDEKVGGDVDRLIEYLAGHGVKTIERHEVEGEVEGQAIAREADRQGVGLLVAGAYGHSRLRQSVFGGATRAFLESETGPHLLLAH